jgi:sensor histidine kinase regulating citrate/malate metabolism
MFLIELLYEYFFTGGEDTCKAEINVGELLFIIFMPVGSLILAFRTMRISNSNYLPESIILFAINGIVFYMYDALKKGEMQKIEKMKLEQQNLLYVNQIKIQKESDEKIKILRHDMKNHIYLIKSFLRRKEYEKLEVYIDRMLESTGLEIAICNSGNYDVDGIVNVKLSKAKDMGAELHLDIKIPDKLNIDSFDLNCILGNLFDNVLNALEKVERKIVYFQMVYEKGVINLCVRNSFDGAIKVNADNQLLSLKKDKKEFHGLGIKSVIEIVEKYDGEFEYEYEKMFFLYTLLCMKSKNK